MVGMCYHITTPRERHPEITKYNVIITTEHCEHDYTMDFENAFHAWEFAEAIAPEGSEISEETYRKVAEALGE